ncbi:MAG: hypothetical protein NT031_17795 [Planctomycetota bacterium]|nr:hypothetical protein [Planctomycetota bacterium]
MPPYSPISRAIRQAISAGGVLFLGVVWCALAAGGEAFGPAMRASDGVPPSWRDVKIDWKGTWEETLAANLDPGKNWLKALEGDESLRQGAGLIVRLREIELLEAMIAHFPQAGAKRQEGYRAVARAYAGLGDRLHAVQWLNRLIAEYPADKALAASALAEIIGLTRPFAALPDARAWAEYANGGIDGLVKAGALPSNHPAVVAAREAMCVALREGQCPESARRVLDSLPPADRKEAWWQKARAELLLGEGHLAQAEAIYRQAGDAARAGALRDQLGLNRPDVEVSPPPPGLEEAAGGDPDDRRQGPAGPAGRSGRADPLRRQRGVADGRRRSSGQCGGLAGPGPAGAGGRPLAVAAVAAAEGRRPGGGGLERGGGGGGLAAGAAISVGEAGAGNADRAGRAGPSRGPV